MEKPPKNNNQIEISQRFKDFQDSRLTYSASSRRISPDIDLLSYLQTFFVFLKPTQIESVFGSTVHFSRLYGGRVTPADYQMTEIQIARMEDLGIHLALTLTNHFFDQQAYKESWKLLEMYHKKGNSIVCTNDELARHLRRDFPLYELKASIIKKLDTLPRIQRALDLYDCFVLPMDKNDDDDLLMSLPEKNRVILFGNANCAYNCPSRSCYVGLSQEIFGKPVTSFCSQNRIERLNLGVVYFDVKKFAEMGFTKIKILPLTPANPKQISRALSFEQRYPYNYLRKYRRLVKMCSFPKSGRTWLRFILANYFNLYYRLGLEVDLHSYFQLLPNHDHVQAKGIGLTRLPRDSRLPVVSASHDFFSTTPPEGTCTPQDQFFLLRSLTDTLISYYFHSIQTLNNFSGTLAEFIRSEEHGAAFLCRYLNSWAPYWLENSVYGLTYENLHNQPFETLAGLLNFLHVPLDPEILQQALQLSSFSRMQTLEKETGLLNEPLAEPDEPPRRMRQGRIGGSAALLSAEDYVFIQEKCEQTLSESAKTLLQKFSLYPLAAPTEQAG